MSSQSLNSESVLSFIEDNLDNASLISKIRTLVSKERHTNDVPKEQQEEVLKRLENYRKNPTSATDLGMFMNDLGEKYGV